MRLGHAGQFEADEIYRQILAVEPGNAKAWHLLGVTAYQSGRSDDATQFIQRALSIQPDFAAAYLNVGSVLSGIGRLDEAVAYIQRALGLVLDSGESALRPGEPAEAPRKGPGSRGALPSGNHT